MRWPWRRAEVRSANYTDQVVARLISAASGVGDSSALASLETAARWWGHGLSSATVSPETSALSAVSASVLDSIGRNLCRTGDSLHVIDIRNGRMTLTPTSSFDVRGSDDPETWRYHVTLTGPTATRTLTVDAESVLHIRYAPSPDRPWAGRSPVQLALDTFKAASLLEGAAQEEFSFTQKQLIAPRRGSGDFAPIDSLSPDIIQKIVESFAQHVGARPSCSPPMSCHPDSGPEPPDSYALLRDRFENSILSACGIPPSLIAPRAPGTAMREGYRQILHALIKPLGLLVAEELQAKIDPSAALSFDALRAADIAGSARALGSLVKSGGLTPQSAAAIVGFDDVEVAEVSA